VQESSFDPSFDEVSRARDIIVSIMALDLDPGTDESTIAASSNLTDDYIAELRESSDATKLVALATLIGLSEHLLYRVSLLTRERPADILADSLARLPWITDSTKAPPEVS
jgi:hypothetical protein